MYVKKIIEKHNASSIECRIYKDKFTKSTVHYNGKGKDCDLNLWNNEAKFFFIEDDFTSGDLVRTMVIVVE